MKKIFLLLAISGFVMFSCTLKLKDTEEKTEKVEKFDKAKKDSIDFVNANGVLTPEILWKFGRVSGVQLSPDNKTILFGVSKYCLHANKGNRNLYTMSVNGGEVTQITDFEGNEWNAIWRPDGKKIAFISAKDSNAQIWEMNTDGRNCKKVSNIEGGINGFKYSPDMHHILFTKDVKLDILPTEKYKDLPETNVKIIEEMMYCHWNQWHDYKYSHIFVANYSDGNVGKYIDIMKSERYDSPLQPWGGMEQISWSNNSDKIAYTCKKMTAKEYTESTNSEIYIYNLKTKKTDNFTKEGFHGYDRSAVFSPDDKKIVWQSMAEDGFEADKDRIIVANIETGEHKDITIGFDQSSSNLKWSKDGSKIYFISGTKATYQIYNIDVETKDIRQITNGRHNYQSYAVAEDFIIGSKMSMSMPTEIFKINKKAGTETQLSFTNDFIYEKITMGKVEKRWIKTTDNKDMLTWIIYPPNFDSTKKYPTLLYCQGGPQSAVSQFFSFRWNFQIMAANDYIIVAPNRRGLPTFGQAWNNQISGDYGGQNMKDYLSAIDEMAKESYIDEKNLGAIGASYGGYSVYWLAGHHENRFSAFISHCGIYDFISMYGSTEEYFFVNKDYEGAYWENPKPKSYEFSPHLAVEKWNTPIMMITGGNDLRIPYTQSLEAFNSAQLNNVPSKLLFFPEESHFVLQPQNAVLWQREFFAWLDKYLK